MTLLAQIVAFEILEASASAWDACLRRQLGDRLRRRSQTPTRALVTSGARSLARSSATGADPAASTPPLPGPHHARRGPRSQTPMRALARSRSLARSLARRPTAPEADPRSQTPMRALARSRSMARSLARSLARRPTAPEADPRSQTPRGPLLDRHGSPPRLSGHRRACPLAALLAQPTPLIETRARVTAVPLVVQRAARAITTAQ